MKFVIHFLSSVVLAHSAVADGPKLNVLFIISDDLNTSLGCYGHPLVKTPHLDRLAGVGVRFDRAYCNYPVCNASRTSFLSGRHPQTTEVISNGVSPRVALGPDFQFLPEHFKAQGYFTAGIGKITHTPQHLNAIQWDVVDDPQHNPASGFDGDWQALKQAPDEAQPDGMTARRAASLLEEHRDEPFFIAAGFHRPHAPRVVPQKYFDLYPHDQLTLPTASTEIDIPKIALPPGYEPDMTDKARLNYLQSYYACVSFMDAQVGVLMEAMDRLDLWRNTVVVFLSDNGYHLGEHGGFWSKMSLMDESERLPLIISAPGMARQPCARPVSLVDLYPSLTELCGLPTPAGLEGRSLAPLLRDPATPWNHPVRAVVMRGEKRDEQFELGRSVYTERHAFIEWPDGSLQLYDDQADPRQVRNLAAETGHEALIAELCLLLLPKNRLPTHRGTGKGKKADLDP